MIFLALPPVNLLACLNRIFFLRDGQKRKSWGPGPTLKRMARPWAQPGGTPKLHLEFN